MQSETGREFSPDLKEFHKDAPSRFNNVEPVTIEYEHFLAGEFRLLRDLKGWGGAEAALNAVCPAGTDLKIPRHRIE